MYPRKRQSCRTRNAGIPGRLRSATFTSALYAHFDNGGDEIVVVA